MANLEQKLAGLNASSEVAQWFSNGHVLTVENIREIYLRYGLSPKSVANLTCSFMVAGGSFTQMTGIKVGVERWQAQLKRMPINIYYDAKRGVNNTDIESVEKYLSGHI